jgi:hypothetical protein
VPLSLYNVNLFSKEGFKMKFSFPIPRSNIVIRGERAVVFEMNGETIDVLDVPFFYFSLDSSLAVDFPVWLLCKDGLKVSPFLHHEAGDQSLQLLGMDATLWERWFQRVVRAQNLCLFWEFKPSKVSTSVPEEMEKITERNRDFYLWELAQREKATTQLGDSSLAGALPVAIWDGNQAIKDKFAELWEQYTSSPNIGSTELYIDPEMITTALEKLIQEFSLDVIHLFPVLYPEPVHVPVGSSILVIGVNSSTTTEQFIFHMREGAKQLSVVEPAQ